MFLRLLAIALTIGIIVLQMMMGGRRRRKRSTWDWGQKPFVIMDNRMVITYEY